VKVYEKESGELVYALRIQGDRFQPHVFAEGEFVVKVGDPDKDLWETRTLRSSTKKDVPPVKLF